MSIPVGGVVRRSPTHQARVLANVALTRRMRRVTVRTDTMRGVPIRPAQDVELLLREPSGRRVKRRYTIRHARPDAGELDLDVLLHGNGPGATWGATATPGDAVDFQGPRGKLELRQAPWHLLVGDESALPAIATILEALPPQEAALAFIEIAGQPDELPMPREVQWVARGHHDPGGSDALAAALVATPLPAGAGHAYLLGESRAMISLRSLVEERGVAHDAIFVKGYWNIGRPDRIAGRRPNS